MGYLNEKIKYVEGEAFQSVHTGFDWSEPLTVWLVKSTSAFRKQFCLLKSELILVLYVILSLFLLSSTEITTAAQEQVFTFHWSMPCSSVSIQRSIFLNFHLE